MDYLVHISPTLGKSYDAERQAWALMGNINQNCMVDNLDEREP